MHFVFGLRPQLQPFHLLHYIALESCRRILRPEKIFLHCHYLPFGVYWDTIRPYLELVRVDPAAEVLTADYDDTLVPDQYRYAHHSDFIRLDALIEHGGVYADIDTVFLRPYPDDLYRKPFVIGREPHVTDELTGESRPSLCNAVLMSRPGSEFAVAWRQRMGSAINGTWSNHSGFLARVLTAERPAAVHVEPVESFFKIPCSPEGLAALFGKDPVDLTGSYSIHLWEHVWWSPDRTDFSTRHAGELNLASLRKSDTALGRMVRPFLPDIDVDDLPA